MRHLRTMALAAVVALPLGACAAGPPATGWSSSASAQLQHDVQLVSGAAAARDVPAATAALMVLRQHLDAARRAGTVSRARADAIEAAATKVAADLDALARASATRPTPTPTATPTPTPTPTPRPTATRTPAHSSAPAPPPRTHRVTVARAPEHHKHHEGGKHGGHGDH